MPCMVNIYYLKINSLASNSSLNLGSTFHNSHTANTKSNGDNSSVGDHSPAEAMMKNMVYDPDINDQNEYGNADTAFNNQPG
ncbi:spore germination protein [Fictibacillus sp. NRS-1165]|uniref:spore germination protein n=1 Tax=Fictibacillus sp. NRS-1165 TaxID=3144463 RepID=UPI003D25CA55